MVASGEGECGRGEEHYGCGECGAVEMLRCIDSSVKQCCQPSRPSDITEDGTGRRLAVIFEAGRGRMEGTAVDCKFPSPAVIGRYPLMICESSYIIDIQL